MLELSSEKKGLHYANSVNFIDLTTSQQDLLDSCEKESHSLCRYHSKSSTIGVGDEKRLSALGIDTKIQEASLPF